MYPAEGGINAFLFPVKDVNVIWLNLLSRNNSYKAETIVIMMNLEIPYQYKNEMIQLLHSVFFLDVEFIFLRSQVWQKERDM